MAELANLLVAYAEEATLITLFYAGAFAIYRATRTQPARQTPETSLA